MRVIQDRRAAKTIRIKESAYYEARVAAVTARKSLGQWLEEAIREKLEREPEQANEEVP